MIRDITLGQYYPGDSFIHRLDPRLKIIALLVFIVALFITSEFYGFIFTAVYLAAVIIVSKVPIGFILRGMKPVLLILICTFIINIFVIKGGDVIFKLGFLSIEQNGIKMAVFLVTRLILLIIGSSMLTFTTKPMMLTDGLESLMGPLKKIGVPSHELAMMMSIALRFIPTLLEETDKIMKAQLARGADFETGSIVKRAKGLIPILIPLFISAFRRADELAMAMEARCYRGGENRTRMNALKFGIRDLAAGIITVLMVAGIVITKIIM